MKKIILTIFLLFNFIALPALGAGLGDAGKVVKDVAGKSGVETGQTVGDVTGMVINAALTLVGLIFMILMVYAGYLWMTARGEEEQIKKAQKIIISSIIGLVLVLSAYATTSLVVSRFQTTP